MRFAIILLAIMPLVAQSTVTFNKDIAPIVWSHCASCHRPGEAGPFPLLNYADVRKHSTQIVQVTQQRLMPPWLPEPDHGDFVGSLRLKSEQLTLIARWVREGMAEGNPADLPALPHFPDSWQLGPPDLIVRMAKPFTLPAATGDIFRNFVLPLKLPAKKYVRAFELRPAGNKRVVHHANLIMDRGRQLRRRDGEDGQPGFPGMDVETEVSGDFDPDSHFLFWKPGAPAQQEPADMSWSLDPGSDLILNLHLQPSGRPETIEAEVGLYFTGEVPTRHPMLLQLEHDGAINIPPGNRAFTVTDHFRLPIAVDLLAVYPHAHYIGKQFEAWAELPGGARQPLLEINDWDINWQSTFTYRQPVRLPAGTTLFMRIRYDNAATNPRNPARPPQRVTAGNRSQDEMGHVWFQVLPVAARNVQDDPRLLLQQALMQRRIEKYPADFVAHFNLGAALQNLGRLDEALPYLEKAVRIRPSNAMARNNLAVSLFAAERFDEAAKEFRVALTLDSAYQNARYNLARTLAKKGDIPGAFDEVQDHLKANPNDAAAHDFIGRLYSAKGQLPNSLPHFRKATELEPTNAAFQSNLGAALASLGELDAAAQAFEKALRLDPSSQAARDNLARVRKSMQKGPRP